jgi:4-amino-4-deoxy-L-arabinose transferase-like glycosyltransferase
MSILFKILTLLVVIINLMFAGGIFGLLSPRYGLAVCVFAAIILFLLFKDKKLSSGQLLKDTRVFEKLLWLFVLIFFLTSFIRTFAPPAVLDVLVYHLNVPKRYIQARGFVNLVQTPMSNIPLGSEMLFMLAMLAGSDCLAQTVAFLLSVLLFYSVYKFGEINFDKKTGLLAASLMTATAVFHMESFYALTDIALTLFSFAAFWSLWNYRNSANFKDLIFFGIFSGTSLAIKMNGVIFIGLLFIYFLFVIATNNQLNGQRKIIYFVTPLSICLLLYSPWLLKAYYFTGNPVYPFCDSLFNLRSPYNLMKAPGWSKPSTHGIFQIIPRNLFGYIYYPFLISFRPACYADDFAGPLFLISFLIAVYKKFWKVKLLRLLIIFAWLTYSLYFLTTPLVRYMFIVICLISLICGWAVLTFLKENKGLAGGILQFIVLGYLSLFLAKSVFEKSKAYPAVFGVQTIEDFHTNYEHGFRWFKDFQFLNTTLSPDDRVLIFTTQSYYLDTAYVSADVLQSGLLNLKKTNGCNDFLGYLVNENIRYIWFDEEDSEDCYNDKVLSLVKELVKSQRVQCVYHNKQQNSFVYRVT